ncbi:PulJ/GspJ family protein [Pararhodobacter sp.]|uniref:PulJ/GspJ family protein n=1 Tax=Pararhodobacter sp. TaxID=2127056 RepID=UPI002AFE0EAF|nr:prepilin-type N-terminal cleavage/methylation domain-containing protein [Pararhodobacter sp.]
MTRRNRGFTLIELLVAMAILAVVSLMAVQSLSGALFQREVMTRVDQTAADLARVLALLRHDLEAAAPLAQRDAAGLALPAITVQRNGFSLMRSGVAPMPGGEGGGFGRVDWALAADGTLSRRLTPDTARDEAPRVALLTQVSNLSLEALGGAMPTADDPTLLPRGFAVTVTHAQHGALRLVVAR